MACAAPVDRPEVEVALLGPVEIRGTAGEFTRPAARELVAYLAAHRQGARTDVWGAALWPDRSVAPSTLHSTASVARRALGRSRSGADHLPRSGRHLRLADTVGTDVERFARLAASPDPGRWREALALVRGRFLEGLRLSDWAVLDGTQSAVEAMVVDIALKGAALMVGSGRGDEAEWMVRRALRVRPYDERLYRVLMRASVAKGDRIGLRSTMSELLCVAGEGPGPSTGARRAHDVAAYAVLHPLTVALYRELGRGERPAAGGDAARL